MRDPSGFRWNPLHRGPVGIPPGQGTALWPRQNAT